MQQLFDAASAVAGFQLLIAEPCVGADQQFDSPWPGFRFGMRVEKLFQLNGAFASGFVSVSSTSSDSSSSSSAISAAVFCFGGCSLGSSGPGFSES